MAKVSRRRWRPKRSETLCDWSRWRNELGVILNLWRKFMSWRANEMFSRREPKCMWWHNLTLCFVHIYPSPSDGEQKNNIYSCLCAHKFVFLSTFDFVKCLLSWCGKPRKIALLPTNSKMFGERSQEIRDDVQKAFVERSAWFWIKIFEIILVCCVWD